MEFNELVDKLKEEFPDKAIDISESLDLLRETIDDAIVAICEKSGVALNDRIFDDVHIYNDMIESADACEKKVEELIIMLEVDELEIEDETEESAERKMIPNYDDYLVDRKVEHTLYENFTHIRPAGFKINSQQTFEVKPGGRCWLKHVRFYWHWMRKNS